MRRARLARSTKVTGFARSIGLDCARPDGVAAARARGQRRVSWSTWSCSMKRIGFAFNPTKPAAMELCDRALTWCAAPRRRGWSNESNDTPALVAELQTTDGLVVLGGDGTFLRAARALAAGRRAGAWASTRAESASCRRSSQRRSRRRWVSCAIDNYGIEARMMLEATLIRAEWHRARPGRSVRRAQRRGDRARRRGARAAPRGRDRRLAPGDLHRRRRRGRHAHRLDRVLVQRRRPDPRPDSAQPGRHADRRLPVVDPIDRRRPAAHGPRPADRRPAGIVSIDGRDDYPIAVGDIVEIRALPRPMRFIEPVGALPFWDLLRQKAALLPA